MTTQYIGTLTKTHGINGDFILADVEHLPELKSGTKLRLGFSAAFAKPYVLESMREYRHGAILHLKGVDTMSAAELLLEQGVFVERSALQQSDVSQYAETIAGFEVRDAANSAVLGRVRDVWQSPAHRTLVVETASDDEVLIPYVPAIVVSVDLANKFVMVNAPEGLFDLNALESVDTEDEVEEEEIFEDEHDAEDEMGEED